jgi:transposase
VTERELERRVKHRLAVLKHVEEVSGSGSAIWTPPEEGLTWWPAGPLRRPRLKNRKVVERAFNHFKNWRGLATRYDGALTYQGGLVLAAILLWLA